MLLKGKLTPRRKLLLAIVVVLLLAVAWAGWAGMAATRGVETREMDWNEDGTVSRTEIAQSLYAVTATRDREGARECTTFRWYRSGETIRRVCKTEFDTATPATDK